MGFIADNFHLDPDYAPRDWLGKATRVVLRLEKKRLHPDKNHHKYGTIYYCVIVPKALLANRPELQTRLVRWSYSEEGDCWVIPFNTEARAQRCFDTELATADPP